MKLLRQLFDKKNKVPLKDQEIWMVRTSYQKIINERDEVGALFYQNLFDLEPSLKELFSGDIETQQKKLMNMLDKVVLGLNDLETLLPSVRELGRNHGSYGVKPEYFSLVGASLLSSLETKMGKDWTPELHEAWTSFYTLLAVTMKSELVNVA